MKKSIGATTIVFPTPTFVVGTYNGLGKPNAMVVAWGGICCSNPPCLSVSLRKATYSYKNIVDRKCFTVNIPSEKYVKEVDYFGMVSGKDIDKFAATKLTPVRSEFVNAPYIMEFPFALECELIHTLEIGLHTLFVGKILDLKAEESILDDKGTIDMEKVKPIIFAPANRKYYSTGKFLANAFTMGKQF